MSKINKLFDSIVLATFYGIDFKSILRNEDARTAAENLVKEIAKHSKNMNVIHCAEQAIESTDEEIEQ